MRRRPVGNRRSDGDLGVARAALARAAEMVRTRRAGRMIYYSLDDGHVRVLLDVGLEHLRHASDPSKP